MSIGEFPFRRLTRDDAPEYHAFRQKQLAAYPTAFTSTAEEERMRSVAWAADRIASPDRPHDFIMAALACDSSLIGIAGLSVPEQRQARHKGTLFGMAVDIQASGRGVGAGLARRLLAEAGRIPDLLQVVLTVSEGNARAERLYRSFGFKVFGREPRAVIVNGQAVTKVHMVLMLDAYTSKSSNTQVLPTFG